MACTPAHQTSVTFTASSVTTLTLKSPRFGNGEPLDPHIIVHRTRSGDVYKYKRGSLLKQFSLTFDKIDKDTAAAIRTFIGDSAGKTITYTDHFGTAFAGCIKSPELREVAGQIGFEWNLTFEID
jgi:hypothetical protein